MFYENFPLFLDSVLFAFSNDYNTVKSVNELKEIVFKKELSKGYDLNTPDENLKRLNSSLFTYVDYLEYALAFLHQEELVIFDKLRRSDEKSVTITSKGFFKIKTEGFATKIKNDKFNLKLQRIVWYSALITLGITVYTQLIKTNTSCNETSKTYVNCNCKTQSYPTQDKSPLQLKEK